MRYGQVSWWLSRVAYEVPVGLREHPRSEAEGAGNELSAGCRFPLLAGASLGYPSKSPIATSVGVTMLMMTFIPM